MKLRSINNVDITNKAVLLRVDFNVSFDKEGKILDDFRLRAEVGPVQRLLERGAKLVMVSHLGRPDKDGKGDLSMEKIAAHFGELTDKKIMFASLEDAGLKERIEAMAPGEAAFLENIRFYPEETENGEALAKKLADLAEIYVNDAFAVSHRKHASVHAITALLPSYAGELLEKEVQILEQIINNPKRPLTVIVGGAKISTKIQLIDTFLSEKGADHLLVGGALANTVLLACGINIGTSLVERDMMEKVKALDIADRRLHLPRDVVVLRKEGDAQSIAVKPVEQVGDNEAIYDIGPETVKAFCGIVAKSAMIIWNGPMGFFEDERFAHGSRELARAIVDSDAVSVIGGGETPVVLEDMKILDRVDHLSTGGGAMMEFLAGKVLPGIAVLEEDEHNK